MPQNLLPFLLLSTGKPQLNFPRVFEAILIALVTAFLTGQIVIAKMEVKLEYIERDIIKMDTSLEKIHDKMDKHKERKHK